MAPINLFLLLSKSLWDKIAIWLQLELELYYVIPLMQHTLGWAITQRYVALDQPFAGSGYFFLHNCFSMCVLMHEHMHVCVSLHVITEDKCTVVLSKTLGFGSAGLLFSVPGLTEWSHSQGSNRMLSLSALLSPPPLYPLLHNWHSIMGAGFGEGKHREYLGESEKWSGGGRDTKGTRRESSEGGVR